MALNVHRKSMGRAAAHRSECPTSTVANSRRLAFTDASMHGLFLFPSGEIVFFSAKIGREPP